MNCQNYRDLSVIERIKYLGMLIHAVQNDDFLFEAGKGIISIAEKNMLFKGVVIMPENPNEDVRESAPHT
jgi:uncharacterized protein YdeI (BOF family)